MPKCSQNTKPIPLIQHKTFSCSARFCRVHMLHHYRGRQSSLTGIFVLSTNDILIFILFPYRLGQNVLLPHIKHTCRSEAGRFAIYVCIFTITCTVLLIFCYYCTSIFLIYFVVNSHLLFLFFSMINTCTFRKKREKKTTLVLLDQRTLFFISENRIIFFIL